VPSRTQNAISAVTIDRRRVRGGKRVLASGVGVQAVVIEERSHLGPLDRLLPVERQRQVRVLGDPRGEELVPRLHPLGGDVGIGGGLTTGARRQREEDPAPELAGEVEQGVERIGIDRSVPTSLYPMSTTTTSRAEAGLPGLATSSNATGRMAADV
jgi:hypothetical protein